MREFLAVCMIIGKKEEKIIQTRKGEKCRLENGASFSRVRDFEGAKMMFKQISREGKQKQGKWKIW